MNGALAAAVGAVVALGVTPLAAGVARRTGVVDRPGALKVHREPVPYLGGLGVLAGLSAPVVATRPSYLLPLLAAAALGVADDARDLSPRTRLAVEAGVGVLVAVVVPTGWGPAAAVFTVVGTVALINAVNLIDGLDGLASATVAAGAFVLSASLTSDARVLALTTGGACVGFLVHNRPPARVYLGDGGSYLLGTALAVLVSASWHEDRPAAIGIGALAAVAVPGVELVTTVLRRAAARGSLFSGDRSHLYDRLQRMGWPVAAISTAYGAGQALLAALGWVGARSSTAGAVGATAAALLVPLIVTAVVTRRALE